MENTNVLDSFKELGYLIQEPTTDKTYFFIKQTEKGTRRIYVKLKKKIAAYRKIRRIRFSSYSETVRGEDVKQDYLFCFMNYLQNLSMAYYKTELLYAMIPNSLYHY